MNIHRLLSIIIIVVLTISCSSEKEKVEHALMTCIYNSYDDEGNALKKAIYDYETLLLEQGFLADRSGESYKKAFDLIKQNNGFKNKPSATFQGFLINIPPPNNKLTLACNEILSDTLNYDFTSIKAIDNVMQKHMTSSDLKPEAIAIDILSVLDKEDFENDYHKMRIYSMLNLMK